MARIAQRLIAAGASPERAAQFERQFAAARPGVKPKALEDAFDAELGAISQSIWPNTFRPPAVDDPEIDNYIIGVYGQQKYDSLTKGALSRFAPNFIKAENSDSQFSRDLTSAIKQGVSLGDLIGDIRDAEVNNPAALGNLTVEDAIKVTTNLFNEYSNAQTKTTTAKNKFLEGDKYYKAGLPHPNLKYGERTDLAKGIIDYRTNPTVNKILSDPVEFQKFSTKRAAGVERARGLATRAGDALSRRELIGIEAQDPRQLFEQDVFKSFTETYKGTPFFDEVKRRESVKGKTIK